MKRHILIVSLVLVAISFLADNFILNFISSSRISFLDSFFINLAEYFNYFVIALVIGLLSIIKKSKRLLLKLGLSFISSGIIVFLLKLVIERPRPLSNIIEVTNSSFPSGHTTIMFALFPIIYYNFNKKVGYVWLAISILVAFSRLYLGVHHLSDIFSGLILGLIIGESIIKLSSLKFRYNYEGY